MAIVHQLSKEPRIGATFGRLKNGFAHIGSSVAPWSVASRELAASGIATRKVPSILINTMPKSGSIYLTRTIATSLGIEYSLTSLVDGLFPTYHMNPAALERFICGAVVRQEHFDASPHNLAMCAHYVDRLVLHVRDPRQATLSWTHHFNRLRDLDPSSTVGTIRQPPEDYCCWPFKRQLDWHIDGHLVSLVEWLRQWISAEGKSSLKILRTQYEELVNAERALFDRILAFHGIQVDGIEMRTPEKTIEYHYRCGRPDEWRDIFTEQQKARSLAIIGRDMLDHFGWSTD